MNEHYERSEKVKAKIDEAFRKTSEETKKSDYYFTGKQDYWSSLMAGS